MGRLILVLMFLLVAAGCASMSPTRRESPQSASDTGKSAVTHALGSPIRDMNIRQADVHPVLLQALADVYASPATRDCAALVEEIVALDRELGEDFDTRPFSGRKDSLLVGVLASAIKGLMPYRGIVRRLSGAESRERQMAAAIAAGGIRHGFLKGLGESHDCPLPAAPDRAARGKVEGVPEKVVGTRW